ncbi:hypothetical protein D9M73_201530 [compost metagenome]
MQPGQVAIIDQHIVGMAQALFAAGLGLENGLHLFRAGLVAQQGALDLQLLRGIDHQQALGALKLARFDHQRRHKHRIRRLGLGQVTENLLTDQRMQQGFQPAPLLGVAEDQLAQCRTVQLAIFLQHTGTEALDDTGQCRTPGFDHPARGLIGIHQVHAQLDKALGRGTFATADAAGEAENPGSESSGGHHIPERFR